MPHTYIVPTPIAKCSACGKEEELRPYGKDGAWVCFECAMKDEAEAGRQFDKQFLNKARKPGGVLILGMPAKKQQP
jgi:phage/plasmid primase-like uncharacterized protein